ncbi:hypothetical protein M9458_032740, partial [Cirrhinus mrigala]
PCQPFGSTLALHSLVFALVPLSFQINLSWLSLSPHHRLPSLREHLDPPPPQLHRIPLFLRFPCCSRSLHYHP